MTRSNYFLPRIALLISIAFSIAALTAYSTAWGEEQTEQNQNTGTLTLQLKLDTAPATDADKDNSAADKAQATKDVQKAIADVRQKMAETKAKLDEMNAKMEATRKELQETRKELLNLNKQLNELAAKNGVPNQRLPLANLRLRAATPSGATPSKAVEDAQKAYEDQKRAEKERLEKDPKWQPSYEPGAVIEFGEKGNKPTINNFCLGGDGNLLVCCGGEKVEMVEGKADDESQNISTMVNGKPLVRHRKTTNYPSEIRIVSPEGKKLGAWTLEANPQAICLGEDGTVFVGGAGKLVKLDKDGKVLLTADVPNAAEVPRPKLEAEPKAESEEDAAAAKKAREEKVAELQKQMTEISKEYSKLVQEARKDLKPDDEESTKAYQEKIREPQQKLMAASQELAAARLTPEMRFQQAETAWKQKMTITSITVSGNDVFLACPMTKTYGYAVWRTDLNFENPKKIIESLSGCCSQMDIKTKDGEVWVAHNAKHKVERYDREGKLLSSFGKTDRINADGFGGCCEPKNLRFGLGPNSGLYACESGPPTCVKHFSTAGEFKGVIAIAPWTSGCVRVTTEFNGKQFFMLHSDENTIQVFTKKKAEVASEKTTE
jgi:hypothetical protein